MSRLSIGIIFGNDPERTERADVMKSLIEGRTRVLIATDLIGRGIDVQHVRVVINYDFPHHNDTYLHRIGRSGRYGRKGIVINFIASMGDQQRLQTIQSTFNTVIEELPNNFGSIVRDA